MNLNELRSVIDVMDAELIHLLGKRLTLACHLGEIKKRLGRPIDDPAREDEVLAHVAQLAAQEGVPEGDAETIYRAIIAMCRKAQNKGTIYGK